MACRCSEVSREGLRRTPEEVDPAKTDEGDTAPGEEESDSNGPAVASEEGDSE